MDPQWLNFCVALGVGLLIGLERERSKGDGPERRPAGIRTFALASLLGAIAFTLGGVLLVAVAAGGVAALTVFSHARSHESDPGLTTEIGLLTTPFLGALAVSRPTLAAGLSVAITVVFAAKTQLHGLVKGVLTDTEVKDGLVFAIATLVIWPQLPDRSLGPASAINLHQLWLVVVLVLAIGAAGHVAIRILGRRYGLPVAGLAAGFVSSTAAIASMADRVARDPGSMGPAIVGSALSTVATFLQMAVLLSMVSKSTFVLLAPILATGAIVAALYALAFAVGHEGTSSSHEAEPGRAFSVTAALVLAATLAVMLIGAAALQDRFGESGVIAGATIAGIVDAHAAAVSVASLVESSGFTPREAVTPILAAMTSNACAKIMMAISVGSRGFALRIVPAVVLSILAMWTLVAIRLLP